MHWLYLLASVVCFALALVRTMPSLAVLVLLLGALGFLVAWILGLVSNRIASRSRDVSHILGPDELRVMREQADARRAAQAKAPEGES